MTSPRVPHLVPAWWHTDENQAHHVMLGDEHLGNIELVDGRLEFEVAELVIIKALDNTEGA